ncbi:HAMP domain-containing histidine kinase [Solihabitans fulvus]|uniref:histidine kinase n=1 Tax=Solihabitans fulvus TaxID=1892852 RepID=A0A5B2WQ83_9PSEU|nr:HAMP domain-containing sensor histidine kinase [Solihabitans fulvus]KAA2252167.1 HAMP domain-containing histidine kinase [Solihabitans fulvus]
MTSTAPAGAHPANGRFQQVSLRNRISLLAAFCVAGAVALVSLGAYATVRTDLYSQLDASLNNGAQKLMNNIQAEQGGAATIPPYFQELTGVKFDFIKSNGQSALQGDVSRPAVSSVEIDVASGKQTTSIRNDDHTGTRVLAVPYRPGVALVISQSLQPTQSTLNQLSLVLFVIGGVGVLVAALAGTAVAATGLRPVQRLTAATERVARTGDLRPIPVSGDDELARLSASFNAMLAAVADSQERQRRLVADAGHELRTPLTSMRTNLELLLASEKPDAPTLSEEDKTDIHADVRAQLDELTTLIGDLVELAREDAPQMVQEPIDLVEVVERALDRARRRATDVRFDVRTQPWSLLGDSSALERAVLNLLDNAVKFSPPGGVVRLELHRIAESTAVVEVADSGPGIANEDLPYVFERFYRSSEARTLPGSGLGLAIVKQVVERHGGSAHVGRAPEGGALFSLALPGRP